MYTRLMWAGYAQNESTAPATEVGHILDVSTVLDDISALFRIPGIKASFPGDPDPPARKQKAEATSAAAVTTKDTSEFTEAETHANLLSTARRMERAKSCPRQRPRRADQELADEAAGRTRRAVLSGRRGFRNRRGDVDRDRTGGIFAEMGTSWV